MSKYKFKLDALLKLRHLKEEQCKLEIGRLQIQITNFKKLIAKHEDEIGQAYQSQEQELNQGLSGVEARFYPFFVSGKRAHIDKIQNELNELQKEIDKKYEALKKLRGDVKVIEQMKDKDHKKYKKELEKKAFAEMEEQTQNWRIMTEKK